MFRNVYAVHSSLEFTRKSHITALYDQPKILSNNERKANERKAFAELVAHSKDEQEQYYQILK
jgi:hypothetical protein